MKRARRTHDLGRGRPRPLRYGATGLGAALVAGFLAGSSVFPAQPPAAEPPNAPAALADQALAAYNASDYPAAERLASRYIEAARLGGITGRKLAEIQFVLGHSRYEIQHRSQAPYPGDYRADVVSPLEESFRILQDNPAFRTLLLGNAYFELWTAGGRHDADAEAQAHWYFLKSILIRESETPLLTRDALEGTPPIPRGSPATSCSTWTGASSWRAAPPLRISTSTGSARWRPGACRPRTPIVSGRSTTSRISTAAT